MKTDLKNTTYIIPLRIDSIEHFRNRLLIIEKLLPNRNRKRINSYC